MSVCVLGDGRNPGPTDGPWLLALVCCPASGGDVRIKESAFHAAEHGGSPGETARILLCDKGVSLLPVSVQAAGCVCVRQCLKTVLYVFLAS